MIRIQKTLKMIDLQLNLLLVGKCQTYLLLWRSKTKEKPVNIPKAIRINPSFSLWRGEKKPSFLPWDAFILCFSSDAWLHTRLRPLPSTLPCLWSATLLRPPKKPACVRRTLQEYTFESCSSALSYCFFSQIDIKRDYVRPISTQARWNKSRLLRWAQAAAPCHVPGRSQPSGI